MASKFLVHRTALDTYHFPTIRPLARTLALWSDDAVVMGCRHEMLRLAHALRARAVRERLDWNSGQ